MSTFRVNETMVVTCFTRAASGEPLFVVREFDTKVIRAKKANKKGLSEQAIRASVRQAILNLDLQLLPATKEEINFLKSVGILGKRAPSASLLTGNDMARLLEQFGRFQMAAQLRASLKTVAPTPIVDFDAARELIAANQVIALATVGTPSPPYAKLKKKRIKAAIANGSVSSSSLSNSTGSGTASSSATGASSGSKRKASQAFNSESIPNKGGSLNDWNEKDDMYDQHKMKDEQSTDSLALGSTRTSTNNWNQMKVDRRTAMVDEDSEDDDGSMHDGNDDEDDGRDASDDDEYSSGVNAAKRRRTSSMPDIHSIAGSGSASAEASASLMSSSASPLLITANSTASTDSGLQGMHALLSAAASRMPTEPFATSSAVSPLREDSVAPPSSLLPRTSSIGTTTASSLISTRSLSSHRTSVGAPSPALQSLRLARTFSGTTFTAMKSPSANIQSPFPPALSPTAVSSSSSSAAAAAAAIGGVSSLSSSGSANFMQTISPILNSRIPLSVPLPTIQRTNSPNIYPNGSLSSPHARAALPTVFNRLQAASPPIHVRTVGTLPSPTATALSGSAAVGLNTASFSAANPTMHSHVAMIGSQMEYFSPRQSNGNYSNPVHINSTSAVPSINANAVLSSSASFLLSSSNAPVSASVASPSSAAITASSSPHGSASVLSAQPLTAATLAAAPSASVSCLASAPGLSPLSSDTEMDSFASTPLTSRTPSPPLSVQASGSASHSAATLSQRPATAAVSLPIDKSGCAQMSEAFDRPSIAASS